VLELKSPDQPIHRRVSCASGKNAGFAFRHGKDDIRFVGRVRLLDINIDVVQEPQVVEPLD